MSILILIARGGRIGHLLPLQFCDGGRTEVTNLADVMVYMVGIEAG